MYVTSLFTGKSKSIELMISDCKLQRKESYFCVSCCSASTTYWTLSRIPRLFAHLTQCVDNGLLRHLCLEHFFYGLLRRASQSYFAIASGAISINSALPTASGAIVLNSALTLVLCALLLPLSPLRPFAPSFWYFSCHGPLRHISMALDNSLAIGTATAKTGTSKSHTIHHVCITGNV